jgi:hypothetical protein
MKKWLYVFDNPKDDVYEKPKLVYNKENNTIMPNVGDETSDKAVRNASVWGMQVKRMQVTKRHEY